MGINGSRLFLYFLIRGDKNSSHHNSKYYIDEEPGIEESGAEDLVIQSNYSLLHFVVGESMDALRASIGTIAPWNVMKVAESIDLEKYAKGRKKKEIA